jgi:PHD/YefM family antitoxin component YafN of YafNO toxin-antitoxin module
VLHWRFATVAITTLSSLEFNQEASRAKDAAERGPVFIADRGRPTHVLLTMEEYLRITGKRENIVHPLAMPEADDVVFEPPRLSGSLYRPAVFD